MRTPGCLTLAIAALTVCFLVQELGWPTLIILGVALHVVAGILNLLFGTRRP